ncbi:MAG: GNAT family N-acetyltransferase [Microbacteriaceae bacterium]
MTVQPIDTESAARLHETGLRFDLVDTADRTTFEKWFEAETRGFHGPRASATTTAEFLDGVAERRTSGVWDDSGADPLTPVATVSAWATPLTVPGERSVEAWGITSVTVASTHRRRGIARCLLEAELRTAHARGIPLAMLTVSESTIYGRFGFAPAVMATDYEIDTQKARWVGPKPSGRVQFVPLEQLRREAPDLVERSRLRSAGEIGTWTHLWDRTFGISTDDSKLAGSTRAIRYDDADGTPQGFALYTLTEDPRDFSRHTAHVRSLVTTTDDAYAGLWSFLLELDLTTTLLVPLRSVDEPVRWQVSDFRAVRAAETRDHLWVRILDVVDALGGREYFAPLDVVVEVSDDLGFASGRFHLLNGVVTQTTAEADLSLSVNELGALYLGGVSAQTLQRAGRIIEHTAGSARALDLAFRSPRAPWLSVWF